MGILTKPANLYENHYEVKKIVSAIFPTKNQTELASNDDRMNKLKQYARKVKCVLTLIRESWRIQKSKTRDRESRSVTEKIRCAALHQLHMFLCFGLFTGNRARSQKLHIFLFNVAHLPSYRHMPFNYQNIAQLSQLD